MWSGSQANWEKTTYSLESSLLDPGSTTPTVSSHICETWDNRLGGIFVNALHYLLKSARLHHSATKCLPWMPSMHFHSVPSWENSRRILKGDNCNNVLSYASVDSLPTLNHTLESQVMCNSFGIKHRIILEKKYTKEWFLIRGLHYSCLCCQVYRDVCFSLWGSRL